MNSNKVDFLIVGALAVSCWMAAAAGVAMPGKVIQLGDKPKSNLIDALELRKQDRFR